MKIDTCSKCGRSSDGRAPISEDDEMCYARYAGVPCDGSGMHALVRQAFVAASALYPPAMMARESVYRWRCDRCGYQIPPTAGCTCAACRALDDRVRALANASPHHAHLRRRFVRLEAAMRAHRGDPHEALLRADRARENKRWERVEKRWERLNLRLREVSAKAWAEAFEREREA